MVQADPAAAPAGGPGQRVGEAAEHRRLTRPAVAWAAGVTGLLAYNWWVLVLFKPGLMRSPNELFSNLEVSGQASATAMQHADVAAGLLILGAFLAAGSRSILNGRREWLAMVVFAIAGAVGGIFPETCGDEISAVCRSRELSFELPLRQYVHIAAGICEFGAITVALLFAWWRTRGTHTASGRVYRALLTGAVAAYPLIGLAYLIDRLGGVMEIVFFVGFTVMVMTQLCERTTCLRHVTSGSGRHLAATG